MAAKKTMAEALFPIIKILSFYGFSTTSKDEVDVGRKQRIKTTCITAMMSIAIFSTLFFTIAIYITYFFSDSPHITFLNPRDQKVFCTRYVLYWFYICANATSMAYVVLSEQSKAVMELVDFIELNPRQYKVVKCVATLIAFYYLAVIIAFVIITVQDCWTNLREVYFAAICLNIIILNFTLLPFFTTSLVVTYIAVTVQVAQIYQSNKRNPRRKSPYAAAKIIQNILQYNFALDDMISETDATISTIMFINLQFPLSIFMSVTYLAERNVNLNSELLMAKAIVINHLLQTIMIIVYVLVAARANSLRMSFVQGIQSVIMYDYRINNDFQLLKTRVNHLIEIIHTQLQPRLFTLGFKEEVNIGHLLLIMTRIIELTFSFKFYED